MVDFSKTHIVFCRWQQLYSDAEAGRLRWPDKRQIYAPVRNPRYNESNIALASQLLASCLLRPGSRPGLRTKGFVLSVSKSPV